MSETTSMNPGGPDLTISILIVEDDRRTATLISKWVRSFGHSVAGIANDGLEAVTLARRLDFDLVMMDMSLPTMDGVETARRIREIRNAPIVFCTAIMDGPDSARILKACPAAYLVKPFSPAQLKVAIQRVTAAAIAPRPELAVPA